VIDDGVGDAAVQAIVELDGRVAARAIPELQAMLCDPRYAHRWASIQRAVDEIRANLSVY
jgi:hypothetical protein